HRQRARRLLDAAQRRALMGGLRDGRMDVCVLVVPALPDVASPDPHRPVDTLHVMVLGPPLGGAHGEERGDLPAFLSPESFRRLLPGLHDSLFPAGDLPLPGSLGGPGALLATLV